MSAASFTKRINSAFTTFNDCILKKENELGRFSGTV